jgi:hypothetical protein
MSGAHKFQSIIWKILMANKFIIAKYIRDRDTNGFYDEMISDRQTANLLQEDNTATTLFQDVDNALNELDYLTDLGYVEKRDSEINCIKYRYTMYYSYPIILPVGNFQLVGSTYPMEQSIVSTANKFDSICSTLEEFKKNVRSGIYPNLLDFSYTVDKKFYSDVYEIKNTYFDSLFFFTYESWTELWSSSPLGIPNREGFDEKKWRGVKQLVNVNLADKDKIDEEISSLEWKKDRFGMLILNGKAYWLMKDGNVINYNDFFTHQIFGLPDYLEPGFASIENYLSRIFEDSIAQFLQNKYNYFTKTRTKPAYLGGKEIDVEGYIQQPKQYTICECKFRLGNNAITLDELESFNEKIDGIRHNYENEESNFLQFWLVTNTCNIESEAVQYANANDIYVKIASLPTNWHRRADWSVLNLTTFKNPTMSI